MSVTPFTLAALSVAAALAMPAAHAADAMTVVRDAETGALRAPTAAEAAALASQAVRSNTLRTAPAQTLRKFHGSGATGVRLTGDFMSYSVLLRQPDGSLAEQCFASKEEADAAVQRTAAASPAATAKLETE